MSNFSILNTGLYRTTIHSYSKDIKLNDMLNFIKKNQIFQEQILASNTSLYNELLKATRESNVRKIKQINTSLFNYYKRSIYRTTPFGLFSGMDILSINSASIQNKNRMNIECVDKKIVQINPKWLDKLNEKLVTIHYKKLKYYVNASIIEDNETIKLYIQDRKSGERESIIIERNEIINYFLKLKSTFTSYTDIRNIVSNIGKFTEDDVKELIIDLIDLKILIPETEIPLKNYSLLDKQIEILKKLNMPIKRFESIKEKISNYEKLKIGEGIKKFEDLVNQMYTINREITDPIIVNTILKPKNLNIEPSKLESFENMIKVMINLEYLIMKDLKKQIIEEYLERFGEYQKVKFKDFYNFLLNINFFKDLEYYIEEGFKNSKEVKNVYQKIDESIIDDEIKLENIFKEINLSGKRYYPRSFDLFLEKNSNNTFYLDEMYRSLNVGSTEGRFCNSAITNRKVSASEVELIYRPLTSNLDKLVYGFTEVQKNIPINTVPSNVDKTIMLNEIEIVFQNDEFILWDNKNKTDIYVRKSDNLNLKYLNNIEKTLILFSSGMLLNRNPVKHLMKDRKYIPKITYKGITICNRTWKFINRNVDYKTYLKEIDEIVFAKKLPKFLNIKHLDMKLPINIRDTDDLNCLYKLSRNKEVFLEEIEEEKDKLNRESIVLRVLNTEEKKIFKQARTYEKNTKSLFRRYANFNIKILECYKRYFWTKFFDICNNDFFFINYLDDNHSSLRLRIINITMDQLIKIDKEFHNLEMDNIIHKYSLECFEPEYNRYGGIEKYRDYENIFIIESKEAGKLISEGNEQEKLKNYLLNTVNYIIKSNIDNQKIIDILNATIDYSKINKKDKLICDKLKRNITHQELRSHYLKHFKTLGKAFKNLDVIGLTSLIHLSANRLFGIDKEKENQLKYILIKTLKKLEHER
ncbi:thiopeptide-type bacteriocin biosynthesis protein [Lagierella sp.]|uniref:thiopeptide-type bacteriocin biosynthesis protein n=1 Tax=Lagierella sp. TaxID=2849657 RepID=UPI00261E26E1|nr:thiopeptide-type bacteriocin biosynthesis protein [Lagierella sp.]